MSDVSDWIDEYAKRHHSAELLCDAYAELGPVLDYAVVAFEARRASCSCSRYELMDSLATALDMGSPPAQALREAIEYEERVHAGQN